MSPSARIESLRGGVEVEVNDSVHSVVGKPLPACRVALPGGNCQVAGPRSLAGVAASAPIAKAR